MGKDTGSISTEQPGPEPGVTRLLELKVWKRDSVRAPHKPLLVLLALGALARGQRVLTFAEVDSKLGELLKEFGPSRRAQHPEYPFWRLQSDGVWVVNSDYPMSARASNSDPLLSELRAANATGAFTQVVQQELLARPGAIEGVALQLLEENFPTTLHQDILDAVRLSEPSIVITRRRARDPNFRAAVMVAYQYRCAMCSLDLRLGTMSIGLDAAHIKWFQAYGPDTVANGMALCTLHHKLFEFGAFTVGHDHRVLISEHVNGSQAIEQVLYRHHGEAVAIPSRLEELPQPEFLEWHRREVFKERALP